MAFPTFVSAGAIAVDTTGGASTTPTPPAHVANDILLVVSYNAGGNDMSTVTSNWTKANQTGGTDRYTVFWKRATGAGTGGPVITAAGTDQFAICYVIRNCIVTGSPFEGNDMDGTGDTSPNNTPQTIATLSTLGPDRLAVIISGWDTNIGFSSGNPPSGWTSNNNTQSASGTGCGFAFISKNVETAGDIGAVTVGTLSASVLNSNWKAAFIPNVVSLIPPLFVNSTSFYASTVTQGGQGLQPNIFDDSDNFYVSTVGAGPVNLTPGSYIDSDTFPIQAVISNYPLTPQLFVDTDSIYTATVSATKNLDSALYNDSDSFQTSIVLPGTIDLTPNIFIDSDSFYNAIVSSGGSLQTLIPDIFVDSDTFYSAVVSPGAVNLTSVLFVDVDSFYNQTVSNSNNLTPGLYNDVDSFYVPSVGRGSVNLTPSIYNNSYTFYIPVVSLTGTILTLSLFADSDVIYYPIMYGQNQGIVFNVYNNPDNFYSAKVSNTLSEIVYQLELMNGIEDFSCAFIPVAGIEDFSCAFIPVAGIGDIIIPSGLVTQSDF